MGRATEFLRRHPGLFVAAAAATVVIVGLLMRTSGQESTRAAPSGESGDASTADAGGDGTDTGDRSGGPVSGDGGELGAVNEQEGSRTGASEAGSATTTTRVPPDVAHPRPPIDLEQRPGGSDPVEVARWWAATHTAYVGAEPGRDLAGRLAPFSTAGLRDELARLPAPASYGAPVKIEGVSAASPGDAGQDSSARRILVTVETAGALAIYDLVLQSGADGWVVAEATEL